MTSAEYEFRVSGRMSERAQHAVDEFGAMRVVTPPPETLIYGVVTDDSHLHGMIGLLENLGLHLVSVHRLSCPDEAGR